MSNVPCGSLVDGPHGLPPTPAVIRSHAERLRVYARRAQAGYALRHPDDRIDFSGSQPVHTLRDGIEWRNARRAPRVYRIAAR